MKVGRRWWVEGGEEWRLLAGYDGRRAAVGGDDGYVEVKTEDEDVTLVLRVSLPHSFESFVSSFIACKDIISLEDFRSNEDKYGATSSSRSLNPRAICKYCKKTSHRKIDCPKQKERGLVAATAKETTRATRVRNHLEEKHVTWARFEKKLDRNSTFQAGDSHPKAFTKSA
ncbi:retrovirus-related pol polyprotein from transposon TNT 1-94 [Tanacetum coccineum]